MLTFACSKEDYAVLHGHQIRLFGSFQVFYEGEELLTKKILSALIFWCTNSELVATALRIKENMQN